jgi:hypothetical protein
MSSGHHDNHSSTEPKPVAFTVPFILAAVTILAVVMFLSLCDPKPHNAGEHHEMENPAHAKFEGDTHHSEEASGAATEETAGAAKDTAHAEATPAAHETHQEHH